MDWTNEYINIGVILSYNIVKGDTLSDEERKAYIGLAFRLTANDFNFLSDIFTKVEFIQSLQLN